MVEVASADFRQVVPALDPLVGVVRGPFCASVWRVFLEVGDVLAGFLLQLARLQNPQTDSQALQPDHHRLIRTDLYCYYHLCLKC